MTSREALSRFAAALADGPDEDGPAHPLRALTPTAPGREASGPPSRPSRN
jgi:hypothetical protein